MSRFPYADLCLHRTHLPSSAAPSAGMHRGVADVAALMSTSHSGWPQWNAIAQPVLTASANSAHEFTVAVWESLKSVARCSSRLCIALSSNASRAGAESRETGDLPSPSRVDISAEPSA